MSKTCTPLYLDKDGNKSSHYYDFVAEHGHEAALHNYIQNTIAIATTRASKYTTTEDLLKAGKPMKNRKLKTADYISMSKIIKQNSSDMPDSIKLWKAMELFAADLRLKARAQNNRLTLVDSMTAAKTHFGYDFKSDAVFNENLDQLDHFKKEVEKMWEAQRVEGSYIHEILELAILERNNRLQAFKDGGGQLKPGEIHSFDADAANSLVKEAISQMDPNKLEALSHGVKQSVSDILYKLLNRIDALEIQHDTIFELLPELNIVASNTKFGDANGDTKLVYGIADLVLHSQEKDTAIIIDFKTKSTTSAESFDSAGASHMQGPFSSIPDNAEGHTNLQTSGYAEVLSKDYNIKNIQTETFLIVGKVKPKELTDDIDGETPVRDWTFQYLDKAKSTFKKGVVYNGILRGVFEREGEPKVENTGIESMISTMFQNKLELADSVDEYVDSQLSSITKTKAGKFYWSNPYTNKPITAFNKEEVKKGIKSEYIKYLKSKKEAVTDLVRLFNTGKTRKESIWYSGQFQNKAAYILNGVSNKTHDIYTQATLPELTGVGDDVIVFKSKTDGTLTMMSLTNLYEKAINFNTEGSDEAKTTLFGPFVIDKTVETKYGKGVIPQASTHSIVLFKLGLAAARLSTLNPAFGTVVRLHSVALLGDTDNYRTSSMAEQLPLIAQMHQLLKDGGKDIPNDIAAVMDNKEHFKRESYKQDYFAEFIEEVKMGKDPLHAVGISTQGHKTRSALLKRIKELETDKADLTTDMQLEKRLSSYMNRVYREVAGLDIALSDKDAIFRDPRYIQVSQAYLSLKNLLVMSKPADDGGIMTKLKMHSLKTMDSPYAESMAKMIEHFEQRAREDLMEFMHEHGRLVEELIKEETSVNNLNKRFSNDVYKKVFSKMLADEYEFNADNTENWMRFKDPEVQGNGLTSTQREYIRFFNKQLKLASNKLSPKSIFNHMYPKDGTESKSWLSNSIPIIPSASSIDLQETTDLDHLQNPLKLVGKLLKKAIKPQESAKKGAIDPPWTLNTVMMDQVDTNPGRGSASTRNLLGIDEKGAVTNQPQNIERNPIIILNLYMLNAVKKEHMQEAATAYQAIDASIYNASVMYKDAGMNIEPVRELLSNFNRMLIHGKFEEEDSRVAHTLDAIGKGSSLVMFWGSWRQFITESATVTAQTSSSFLGNAFNKILLKGETKYSAKDLKWAAQQIGTPFGDQMVANYGLFNSDLGQFTSSDYVGTKKSSLMQTKIGFAPMHAVLSQATQTIVLAQMHKDGITKEAFDLDERGIWIYNESKDDRFYVYEDGLDINQQKNPPTSKEDKAKHAYWKAHRRQMQKDGGIRKNKMTRPFTTEHINSMKNYALRLYGSMDSKGMIGAEIVATGRAMAKFRRWMVQKVENVYSPTRSSIKEGKWESYINEDGVETYEFLAQEYEGYIQSIMGLYNGLIQHGGSLSAMQESFSDRRKENLTKILSDLALWGILALIVGELLETDFAKKSVLGKDLSKGLANAVGDIMPAVGLFKTLGSSPMGAVSVSTQAASNTIKAFYNLGIGDIDRAAAMTMKTMESGGSFRTAMGIKDLFTK